MQKPIVGIVPRTEYVNTNYRVQVNYSYLEPLNKRDITPIILPLNSDNINEQSGSSSLMLSELRGKIIGVMSLLLSGSR